MDAGYARDDVAHDCDFGRYIREEGKGEVSQEYEWTKGQRAVINRREVVTIGRVTAFGRAIVGDRTFEKSGRQRTAGNPYRRAQLEPLTPEIEDEMALVIRGREAAHAVHAALDAAGRWLRGAFNLYRASVPDAADVERAERLLVALNKEMTP
jgi:hypothetical protein